VIEGAIEVSVAQIGPPDLQMEASDAIGYILR
jgi:hypothetical protein